MDDQVLLSLGAWIKRRRRALDLTQEALAALVGCSKDLVVKIEGDARRPSRQVAALLAQHLQIPESERDAFVACARAELAPDRLPPPARGVPRAAFAPAVAPDERTVAGLPQGAVTLLFTDVAGSTRLWERHGAAAGSAIARQEALVRQAVAAAGGVVFKTVGDAVCAAFADPAAALAAARALQAEDWEALGWAAPSRRRGGGRGETPLRCCATLQAIARRPRW